MLGVDVRVLATLLAHGSDAPPCGSAVQALASRHGRASMFNGGWYLVMKRSRKSRSSSPGGAWCMLAASPALPYVALSPTILHALGQEPFSRGRPAVELIASPEEALTVFDFQAVAKEKLHYGHVAFLGGTEGEGERTAGTPECRCPLSSEALSARRRSIRPTSPCWADCQIIVIPLRRKRSLDARRVYLKPDFLPAVCTDAPARPGEL